MLEIYQAVLGRHLGHRVISLLMYIFT